MKFSIITPSFNQGRYIRDCIESVRSQSAVDWEHIIIDGGSTDATVDVLKEYPHLQWVSEPDAGQSDGINKGFRQARGDWMMWLNSDDYLTAGALEKVRRHLTAKPGVDVLYGDCDYVNEAGVVVGHKREWDFEWDMLLLYGCFIPSTATFYQRKIIDAGHLLDPAYKVCMDFDYYLRLGWAGFRFAHMPEVLACFRWHDANISSVYAKRRHQERVQLQRQYLNAAGHGWVGNEWLLRLLFRAYQGKRFARRLKRRMGGS